MLFAAFCSFRRVCAKSNKFQVACMNTCTVLQHIYSILYYDLQWMQCSEVFLLGTWLQRLKGNCFWRNQPWQENWTIFLGGSQDVHSCNLSRHSCWKWWLNDDLMVINDANMVIEWSIITVCELEHGPLVAHSQEIVTFPSQHGGSVHIVFF